MEQIGFIGLGIMGMPMAKNLLNAGFPLFVYDINKTAVEALVSYGAKACESPAEVAERAERVIITMLPDSPHVRDVIAAPNGVLHGCRPGQVVVDMSSIAPMVSRELGGMLADKGAEMIDAPVSGGQEKAEKGTLAVMCGGKESVFESVKEILGKMGASVTLVGDLGAGQTTKLVNQMVVGVNIAVIAEGMALAQKAGVDPQRVFSAIRKGLAGSQCMEDKAPRMFSRTYDPGFRINLHIKDLWNVLETSRSLKNSVPLSAQVLEMMLALANDGCETMDHAALGLYYEKLNNVKLSADI